MMHFYLKPLIHLLFLTFISYNGVASYRYIFSAHHRIKVPFLCSSFTDSSPSSIRSDIEHAFGEASRLGIGAFAAAIASSGYARNAYAASISSSSEQRLVLPECSDSIIVLHSKAGKEVVVIGTAHISEDSVVQVRRVIQSVRPEVVMVELDKKRIGKIDEGKTLAELGFDLPPDQPMTIPTTTAATQTAVASDTASAPAPMNIFASAARYVGKKVQSATQVIAGAVLGKVLSEFYESVEKLGFTAGGEFKAAVEEARAIGARVLLGDRDVDVTLQRLSAAAAEVDEDKFASLLKKLSVAEEKMGLNFEALEGSASADKAQISSFVEQMKQKDVTNQLMAIVQDEVPGVYAALIGERDAYLANSLATSAGRRVVGVVGLAHVGGIERWLTQQAGYTSVKRNCP